MSLPSLSVLAPDTELFSAPLRRLGRLPRGKARFVDWRLGFGPVGDTHPIWGLYRFDGSEHIPFERVFLWRRGPTAMELFGWANRIVGADLAALLIESVGDLDHFYDEYFSCRPDLTLTAS